MGSRNVVPVPYLSLKVVIENGNAIFLKCSEEIAIDTLDSCLTKSVSGQMLADVPLGSLFSGGVDSTLTTALMQKSSRQTIHTFTVGFQEMSLMRQSIPKRLLLILELIILS